MRILFLSNFYPPAREGGYAQLCRDVAEVLVSRGHSIAVLTSAHNANEVLVREDHVYRLLHLENDLFDYRPVAFFTSRRRRENQDLAATDHVIEAFRPEIVVVWGMWALSRTLTAHLEQRRDPPVAYYVSDHWPSDPDLHTSYWTLPANHAVLRPLKRLLARVALGMLSAERKSATMTFENAMCVSGAVRENLIEAGLAGFRSATVIHNGIDVEPFLPRARTKAPTHDDGHLALLYAGRLVPEKGVLTAVEAIRLLANEEKCAGLTLTIVGWGLAGYERRLRDLVDAHDLHSQVSFRGAVPRDQMPGLLWSFDVLVFPSVCEEALPRMPQEAMAAGLVVVGTMTGGSSEILVEGENALTFAAEDSRGLAEQIKRLVSDPALRHRLGEAGRRTVLEGFTLDRCVDAVEAYLGDVVAAQARTAQARD